MKKVVFLLCLMGIFLLLVLFKDKKEANDYPSLELIGNNIINIKMNETYIEPGYKASDSIDGDITGKVKITNNIDYNTPGTYEIIYEVVNSSNKKVSIKRFVNVEISDISYKDEFDKIDNTRREWGAKNKKDGTRPIGNATSEELKKYNAYYIGSDEKVIYLTFDEGQNDTYVKEIVDVLNEKGIKATFFFCKSYITSNPTLMKKLVNNGHSVGNHTANHLDMTKLSNKVNFQKYVNQIKQVEDAFKEVTGVPLDKVYREPKGVWSYRSLEIIKNLGYKTYFWSSAYVDFNVELTKEDAYKLMIERIHNGAIYLIHPNNKGNYLALADFIDEAINRGYTFDLVKNIS